MYSEITKGWTTIDPSMEEMRTVYKFLVGIVAPRPIAFVSSINKAGQENLSPFSFFNVVSVDPPIMVFAPTLGRNQARKDTLRNVEEVPEVVIHMVSDHLAHQMSLTSANYPYGTSELKKAGFTRVKSELVSPPRLAEAWVAMECEVTDIHSFGESAGAGSMVICKLLKIHVRNDLMDDEQQLLLDRMRQIGRLGANLYCRAFGDALFEMQRPYSPGVGVDALPSFIKYSKYLSGNDLGELGKLEVLPSSNLLATVRQKTKMQGILQTTESDNDLREKNLCVWAQDLIAREQVLEALAVLMFINES